MTIKPYALITGASSGIGRDLAYEFAKAGYDLVLVARREERLRVLAAELTATYQVHCVVMPLDLQLQDAPARLIDGLKEQNIAVHTLVNNAGFGLRGRFQDLPLNEQLDMIDLNVRALTALSYAVLPAMCARGEGGILNIASTAAFQAGPNMAVYYASKAYVLSFSEALFEEVRPYGVKITAFCPGPVDTEFALRADRLGKRQFRVGALSSPETARAAFNAHCSPRAVVVPAITNRIGAFGAKFLPRALTRKIAARLQKIER